MKFSIDDAILVNAMKSGKLTTQELHDNVLDKLARFRPEVLLSAALGEDCAALSIDDTILVSSDPITAVVEKEKLGALCVTVCCNDVAANGGEPVAMMLTIIMPETCDASDVGVIMDGAVAEAKRLKVEIVGGHTEFSDCVVRPIVSGTAIGRTKRVLKKTDLKPGDKLFVTKTLALEGTCILADIVKPELDENEKRTLEKFNASLSVSRESAALSKIASVSAMHDVTEGGVLGAAAEICFSVGVGAKLYESKMPVDKLSLRLCHENGVDPLRLISSGSMLAAVRGDGSEAKEAMKKLGVEFTEIGEITYGKEVTLIKADGTTENVDVLPDELYKFSGESK